MTTLLAAEPLAEDYLNRLRQDLDRAEVIRFVIAYVSKKGLKAIGAERLAAVLARPGSFGVASLTCSCGFTPLTELFGTVVSEHGVDPDLRYFLEPRVRLRGEEADPVLIHTKLVYLRTRGPDGALSSVLYVGSQNWSGRALGGGSSLRNAEAGLRLAADFTGAHLRGVGTDPFSQANRHMQDLYGLAACVSAGPENLLRFQQWHEAGCQRAPPGRPLTESHVLVAVASANPGRPRRSVGDFDLVGRSIYVQAMDEDFGNEIWQVRDRLFIMCWPSEQALQDSDLPVILLCRLSSLGARGSSSIGGTNQSREPIVGFSAALLDQVIDVKLRTGLRVRASTLDLAPAGTSSRDVDGRATVRYQFLLEVEGVVIPEWMAEDPTATGQASPSVRVWRGDDLFFSGKRTVPAPRPVGYTVDTDDEAREIEQALRRFGVDLERAQARPMVGDRRFGRRTRVEHKVHELYVREEAEPEARARGVGRAERAVASEAVRGRQWSSSRVIDRIERVYAPSTEDLYAWWKTLEEHRAG